MHDNAIIHGQVGIASWAGGEYLGAHGASPARALRRGFLLVGRVVVLCLCLLFLSAQDPARRAVSSPLRFGVDRVVTIKPTIYRHRIYYLDLVFGFRNPAERAQARRLAGDAENLCKQRNDCGQMPLFEITILADGSVLRREQKRPYGHYAFGESGYLRHILVFPLRPESYEITLEVLDYTADLIDANTAVEITSDPRLQDLGD